MLKRLELVGFKSFADKTQFDFPKGVTAIVGPNGSGKSNIVDAVRWVLGEQSAKSLRGGEMADVIFNGSASRRGLGMAEVTMTFDNAQHALATEASEVQITRRVYRDGVGEYLINHQPSRLKDIKDLFLGSGAGADAYCIIEQGRVDVLLQASTKERRTIFEEAAGISRFKAKKIETLRKLEHVEQNLDRLQDIVEEVEKQLRAVKLQAAKAQRYQEYSNRLKELRVSLGLREYHQLAAELASETTLIDNLRSEFEVQKRLTEDCEAKSGALEKALAELNDAVHGQEELLAQSRQQIATQQVTSEHESDVSAELTRDLARLRVRVNELGGRVAHLAKAVADAELELTNVDGQCQEQRQALKVLDERLRESQESIQRLRDQLQTHKADHLELMRKAARLRNDEVSSHSQFNNLTSARDRLHRRSAQAAENLATIDVELQGLIEAENSVQSKLAAARQALSDHRQNQESLRDQHEKTGQRLSELRIERSGLGSRIEVLEGLERSQEGLGTGVRELLELLNNKDENSDWTTVVGLVVDVLKVKREFAPLVDLALGELAQRFVVRDLDKLDKALASRPKPFAGRLGFLPLTAGPPSIPPGQLPAPVADSPALVARADTVATCDVPELADLPVRLLGRTLVVRDLGAAREFAALGSDWRFVTLSGELLEADGRLTVGTHHAETGIISRRSELRELRQNALDLDERIAQTEKELASLRQLATALETQAGKLEQTVSIVAEQAADLHSHVVKHRERRQGLNEEVEQRRDEITSLDQEIDKLDRAWQSAQTEAAEAEQRVLDLQSNIEDLERSLLAEEQARQQREGACTVARVALAQVEERRTALDSRFRQLQSDLGQLRRELSDATTERGQTTTRLRDCQLNTLQASSAIAQHYLVKEGAEQRIAAFSGQRDQARLERKSLAEKTQSARGMLDERQNRLHAHELAASDLKHRRDTMVERLREDYDLSLPDLYEQAQSTGQNNLQAAPDDLEPALIHEEIDELRGKLSRLGNVNLESLQQLSELETRATTLQAQHEDLSNARRALEEIIAKINLDSRRHFTVTLENIRIHFQELFRKLFGGGMADIVLEDENDILESGIEIVARPPGKELRSISLMSGGEKTLTAVALLLAIFRSKPSPFCILDEVDAALDEANVGRFTAVLHEFLDRSHFIIITHSKRTMAVADVLYGITMQESGISKRVAVRFEDWPDEQPAA